MNTRSGGKIKNTSILLCRCFQFCHDVLFQGLPDKTVCTTINKLCASGLKSVTFGVQSIVLGHQSVVATGGFESMSNVPFMVPSSVRRGVGLGHQSLIDGILGDGLVDSKYHIHMGECGEETATKYGISRKDQDEYAIQSYQRAAKYYKVTPSCKHI